MSLDAVRQLRRLINENPDVQRRALPHMNPIDLYHMVRLGKELGLDFTGEEVTQVYAEVMADQDRELSDFELELVAGGGTPPIQGPSTNDPKGPV